MAGVFLKREIGHGDPLSENDALVTVTLYQSLLEILEGDQSGSL